MKDKIYKISRIVLWVLLLVNFFAFVAFTSKKQSQLTYKNVYISVDKDADDHDFVDAKYIENELLDSLDMLSFTDYSISKCKPAKIEKVLYKNPYIKKAIVYTDIPGNLYVHLTQRKPIARVMTDRLDYYITENGSKMPWCSRYTARVPIVTGDFYEGMEYKDSMITEKGREIYSFLQAIDTSDFYKAFCDQLFFDEDNSDLKMIPKVGNNEIIFGDLSDLSDKLNRLRVFYSKVLNNGTLYKYKCINLKFKNQVVCDLHENPVSTDTSN
ncbi:MAG: hypothetical protein HYZ42_01005 [Bacteroidetes bacterium]|nr:hypothetical protein [Bacteroidota bacterium]